MTNILIYMKKFIVVYGGKIMKTIVNNWYNISIGLAILFAALALFTNGDAHQFYLLASAAVLCLHFFEEFGYPGGFPLMGIRIMIGSDEPDSNKWDCNNLSSMFGNWSALVLIYILPLIFPEVRFLTATTIILSIAEVIMHLLLFNIKQKSIYNPGLGTGLLLGVIVAWYLFNGFDSSIYVLSDFVIGFIFFLIVFWFCYRSPWYWKLGRVKGYPLSKRSAYGLEMDKF